MTAINSCDLRIARTQFLIELADKNKGTVTPKKLLAAVGGSQKLLLNVLWIARRSGYVDVTQVRNGKKISHWEIKVTGKQPQVAGSLHLGNRRNKPTVAKPKTVSVDHSASNKLIAKAVRLKTAKIAKTPEQIKAENLAKMKAVTTKRKMKKTVIVNDDTEVSDVTTSYGIDSAWDSTDGLDIKKLVA